VDIFIYGVRLADRRLQASCPKHAPALPHFSPEINSRCGWATVDIVVTVKKPVPGANIFTKLAGRCSFLCDRCHRRLRRSWNMIVGYTHVPRKPNAKPLC
jgi:hypothetical protein